MKREVYEAVGGYKSFESIVDTEFWISAIEIGTKFTCVPEPLYHYRRHENSLSRTKLSLGRDFMKVLLHHHRSLAPHFPMFLRQIIKRGKTTGNPLMDDNNLESEYHILHKEFHDLLERYENLEKRLGESEQELASARKLFSRLAKLVMKK
jgi:hypothetical protein